jgi:hypothetical protein
MHRTNPNNEHWPQVGSGIWTRWWGYLARWLVFGVVVGVFQPVVDDLQPFWREKAFQALLGLLFGFVGAVIFTVAENRLNTPRARWKSWLIVLATWLVVKTIFVTAIALIESS